MIVTCEECTTSFQLDESRIPAGGARVRCSRCKHAFFLPNPAVSQSEAVHDVARAAAADPDLAGLSATEDLNDTTWDGLGGETPSLAESMPAAPAEPDPIAEPSPSPDSDLDAGFEDDEDWQFSEEIRVEGDDHDDDSLSMDFDEGLSDDVSDAISGEIDASDLGPAGSFDNEGFDPSALGENPADSTFETSATYEPEIAAVAEDVSMGGSGLSLGEDPEHTPNDVISSATVDAEAAPARDDSSFGSVDDFSSLMEDDDPQSGAASGGGDGRGSVLDDGLDRVGAYSAAGQSDDLGDPESWDLVGSDEFAASTAPSRRAAGASRAISESVDANEFFSDEEAFDDSGFDLDLATSSLAAGPVGQIARLAGWALSAAAVLAVGYLGFLAESGRWAQAQQTVMNGPLIAQTLQSSWVETTRSGTVLRLTGELRNTSAQTVWPGSVEMALLDRSGERLVVPTIVAGAPVEESVLREASREVLLEQASAGSRRFASSPLAPGEVRAFEALMLEDRLPDTAARFQLELGDPGRAPVASAAPVAAPAIESAATPVAGAAAAIDEPQLGAYVSTR